VLIVEDEPDMAEALRDGLRLEAIAVDRAPGLSVRLKRLPRPFAYAELLARIRA
jgi:DNA-binding response OmpR family regulator